MLGKGHKELRKERGKNENGEGHRKIDNVPKFLKLFQAVYSFDIYMLD